MYVLNINMVIDRVISQNQVDCIDYKELGCLLKPKLPEVF